MDYRDSSDTVIIRNLLYKHLTGKHYYNWYFELMDVIIHIDGFVIDIFISAIIVRLTVIIFHTIVIVFIVAIVTTLSFAIKSYQKE